MKYLQINLAKCVQGPYAENCKTLREINRGINKYRGHSRAWIRKFNIANKSVMPKFEMYLEIQRVQNGQSDLEKEQSWRTYTT